MFNFLKIQVGLCATTLLLAFASCQNNSPAPQAAKQDSTATKPVEPTVLPNVKCYEGKIIEQDLCRKAVIVQIKIDSIGITANVGCLGSFNNVLTLDMPSIAILEECKKDKEIYFTVSELYTVVAGVYSDKFKIIGGCVVQPISAFCNDGTNSYRAGLPSKYATVSSYSFKNCESKK